MRVAFTLIGGSHWTGGHNYLANLLRTLAQYQGQRLTPVLFIGTEGVSPGAEELCAIPGVEVVRTPLLIPSRRTGSLVRAMLWGRDSAMRELFLEQRIDVIFENAQFFGWRLGIPAIAWIPDFQHRVLPAMFPRLSRWKRELGFRAQVLGGRRIMLSSEDARRTCERYFPSTRGRTRTIHFAVPAHDGETDFAAARAIADQYGLPENFFFMPNQFWKHKNHALVVEALAILRRRGMPMVVAASGMQSDPRDPGHFPRLQEQVGRLGVDRDMRFLGVIPYAHLGALMRSCVALLNPSLFEGWSTTVEEARAMGTPMLLSDLDVHREQMEDAAIYFNRFSAEDLADALLGFPVMGLSQRRELADRARTDSIRRVKRFGDEFADLVEAIGRDVQ